MIDRKRRKQELRRRIGPLGWVLRQLVPFSYVGVFGDSDGRVHLVRWRSWFGVQFDVVDIELPRNLVWRRVGDGARKEDDVPLGI